MCEEFNALILNNTRSLVPPHHSQNIIGCKWIYKIKRNSNGSISRFKARLVAKGFHLSPSIDFHDKFSPVVQLTTIHIILTIVVHQNWHIHQLDVNNAFLQGSLTDDVYIQEPQGFVDAQRPTYVFKLHKALYGLRQAPRAWFQESHCFFLDGTSLFINIDGPLTLFLLVYVGDILLTGNSSSLIDKFIGSFTQQYLSLKDLVSLHYFLGVEAFTTPDGIFLS